MRLMSRRVVYGFPACVFSLSLGEQDRYPSVGFPGAMNKSFSFDQDLQNLTFLV